MHTPPPEIPACAAPRFEAATQTWILTRYVDVLAALREPRLTASGARGGGDLDRAGHLAFRAQAAEAACKMLGECLAEFEPLARLRAQALPRDRPVDLVSELAMPWSAQLASSVARPAGNPERLAALSADIFTAAADPRDTHLQARAAQSTLELAGAFSGQLAAFHLQAFVALSQTLPCFLANAWLALLNDPQSAELLRAEPGLMPQAIEELLRHSGPSRAQFRRASEDVELGGATIESGGRVALMLAAANRDPRRFPEPLRLDFHRDSPHHLAFGDGRQSCIGAPMVRAAAAAALAAFLEHLAAARLVAPVLWRGGFAISAPASLLVSR